MNTIRSYRILEFLEDGILVKSIIDDKTQKLTNANIPKFAIVGDILRWCEHNFYDVVDEDGDILYR